MVRDMERRSCAVYLVVRETVVEQPRSIALRSPVYSVPPPVQGGSVHPGLEKKGIRQGTGTGGPEAQTTKKGAQ